jgi:GNAT superfamily N-acetyltransferase
MNNKIAKPWTIRAAEASDLDALRVLYRATWDYERPAAFDRWRYLTSPDGLCPVALAMDGDRLAGAYSLWPVKIRVGRETVLGAQSMDTMTHPDYRGQGIFTDLALACFEIAASRGFEILYGFPNPLSYPGFVRRLNWDHTGNMTHWIRPLRPSGHPRIPSYLGPVADAAVHLLPTGRSRGFEVVVGRPADSALETLLARWREDTKGCAIARDLSWLDWRYAEAAANQYEWIAVYARGELQALGIWGMRDANWGSIADSRAHLTELMGLSSDAISAALAEIIARGRTRKAILLETIANTPATTTALRKAGFFAHRQAPFIVRALTARNLGANIHDHTNWHIAGGDVDTF